MAFDNSIVKFTSVKFDKLSAESTLPAKFARLLKSVPFKDKFEGKTIALKMHLGGDIGYTTIHPIFVSILIEELKINGADVFVTDLYRMENKNFGVRNSKIRGYTEEILNAPIYPVAGVFDKYYYPKPVDFKSLKEIQIAGHVYDADGIVVFSHLKGHGVSSFGGAIKNLAMGCVTQKTRLNLHRLEGGIIWDAGKCTHCEKCIKACRYKANRFDKDGNYRTFFHNCTYCQHCVEVCPGEALVFTGKYYVDFQKGLAMAADEILKTFESGSVFYINMLLDITMQCDCWGFSTPQIVPDIGIVASDDIVSVEKASLDLIGNQDPIPGSINQGRILRQGSHIFERIWGKDPYIQIDIMEKQGLGNSSYKIEEIL